MPFRYGRTHDRGFGEKGRRRTLNLYAEVSTMALDLRSLGPSELSPSSFKAQQGIHHFVQFYESSQELVPAVTRFMAPGLEALDAAVIIADEPRRTAIQQSLRDAGIPIDRLRDEDRYLSLAVDDLLPRFMRDGIPGRENFFATMEAVLEKVGRWSTGVRIYGEMVGKLWTLGYPAAAIRLEELWNQLSTVHDFRLFCGYPADAFEHEDILSLQAICQQHSHVFPPER